jgi:hypothetical protein
MATITAKVRCSKPIMVDHFTFLKSVATATPKLTIPSPAMLHMRGGRNAVSSRAYPDLAELWRDAATALGPPTRARVIVSPRDGRGAFAYYLAGTREVRAGKPKVAEIDVLSADARGPADRAVPSRFRLVASRRTSDFYVRRYVAPAPRKIRPDPLRKPNGTVVLLQPA